MKYHKIACTALLLLMILFNSCKKNTIIPEEKQFIITNEQVMLNPNGDAPLTANIHLDTSVLTKISIIVKGKHGIESDLSNDFTDISTTHDVPVLGLYADSVNSVELIIKSIYGSEQVSKFYTIKTDPLPSGIFPDISIDTRKEGMLVPGMTLVNYFGFKDSPYPQHPFIFDAFGDIRWYLDLTNNPILKNLSYDVGMQRLQNGDLYFGDISSNTVNEIDFEGKLVDSWELPGYQFHHNVQEKPNGNFLVTVSKKGSSTIEDYIIEIDRNSKQIIRTWDLKASLQYSRQTLTTNLSDWIHVNAVIYDPKDNTIIVSGRTQGLIKLDQDNHVVWIMSNHTGWNLSGNHEDLNNYLLQPLDKNNQPITDQNVLDGYINHPDFEWNWYQHAPTLMPNGHLMVFDNGGDNRNFSGTGQYSRAVEFEINTSDKTVKQIWEYGKNRGASTFSHIVSDVQFFNADDHVIFSPGAINNIKSCGKVIEMDYATQNILFEATLVPPSAYSYITFHRTERLNLYPKQYNMIVNF